MFSIGFQNNFDSWRKAAREYLLADVPPDQINWSSAEQPCLLGCEPQGHRRREVSVPAEYIELAKVVACYDDPRKWSLLYRILFRIVNENRHLLNIESDPDVRDARVMEKGVRRDMHKFHAFVRFRQILCGADEIYTAWHEPQHFTVESACPFFVRRFGSMRFSILTPKGCAHWDRKRLTFTEGLRVAPPRSEDEAESFWLVYYSSIFNPFRLKIKAMKTEMPVRHWATLPESRLIPQLIRNANAAVPSDVSKELSEAR